MKLFKQLLSWIVVAGFVIVGQPATALTSGQKIAVLDGIQSWSLPGSSADLDFSRNAGSCALNRIAVQCSSQIAITRATAEYAPWADGHWSSFGAGVPAITDQGLSIWQASTNQALRARDMTNATWVKANVTAALTATGIDNAANSASLLTATAGNGTVLQTLTIGSMAETYSVFIERVTGVGNIQITENNGTSWTTANSSICTTAAGVASNLLTTAYVRCSVEATLANPIIGIRIVTNGDAVNVDFNQDEELAFATPPISTGAATVTRNADVITLQGAALTAALNAKAARFVTNGVQSPTSQNSAMFSFNPQNIRWGGGDNNTPQVSNGTNTITGNLGSGTYAGLTKVSAGFDATSMTVVGNGGSVASTAHAWGSTSGSAWLGCNQGTANFLNGYLLRATFSPVKGVYDTMTTGSNPQ